MVRVSGADTGAVVPVRTAVMAATSLSEADIATIVDRVTRNLQPSILGGAPVCPTSSEGEGQLGKADCAVVRFVRCGTVLGGDVVCAKRE